MPCLDERVYVCEHITEIQPYRNYLCAYCFEHIQERFQESRKTLPCLDYEGEFLDTEYMDEVDLGRIEDKPIAISKKSANVIVKDLKRSVEKTITDQFAKPVK